MGLFENLYDPFMIPADWMGFRRWRRWATSVGGARVLELGVGTGLNLPHYSVAARIFALDSSAEMLRLASRRLRTSAAGTAQLCQALAEALPFCNQAFDAAVCTLVLCNVEDPAQVLREIRRTLRPGAPLRMLEHVRLRNPRISRLQDALTPAWRRVTGGCHLNRDTLALVRQAGFQVKSVDERLGGWLVAVSAQA